MVTADARKMGLMTEQLENFLKQNFQELLTNDGDKFGENFMSLLRELLDLRQKSRLAAPDPVEPTIHKFKARIVQHNGFAYKFHDIKEIIAADADEAKKTAEAKANEIFGVDKWLEARVLPLE